ncbi:28S ribosomal protein S9, mitochondrial-like [Dendronephthya gigantea]|uniref:28S ribosomal protein S9, mitochondrial-like n=1 Tax=Dendronephthya gigantea TaxID=151771 RepID=UPI00106C7C4E|nr:28S ribosomal protein S9, mitochondrial-like [Dendronephthya gigantea]XP_028409847.1 28S ribosomal protein S9, mitochondrial-like [Dendronephthya gigantea]
MAVNLGVGSRVLWRFLHNPGVSRRFFTAVEVEINRCEKCCRSFSTYSKSFQRRKRVEDQSNAEFMAEEIKKYEMGKRWLAKMMGADIETFTDSDVEDSLRYLLPTKLFAKDARPMMKHPSELFPESKSTLSSDGRPIHLAFYTGATAFHDLIYDIFRYQRLSAQNQKSIETQFMETQTDEKDENIEFGEQDKAKVVKQGKMRWLNENEFQAVLKEELKLKDYEVLIHRLKKLASEGDSSEEIKAFLQRFQTPVKHEASQFTVKQLDENGTAHGKGYRKRAMAEVWISSGTGEIVVNDTPLIEYFCKQEDRNQVSHPLITLDCMGKYDIECNVIGGGSTGQSGAIRLAISRALTSISSDFLPRLHSAGLLTRDSRLVERKKPGQKKARKKFAWVKR